MKKMASKASPLHPQQVALFTFAHCQEHKLQRLTIKTSGHDFFLPFLFFPSSSSLSLFRKMDFRQNHYGQQDCEVFCGRRRILQQTKRGFFATALTLFSLMGCVRGSWQQDFFCSLKTQLSKYAFKDQKILQLKLQFNFYLLSFSILYCRKMEFMRLPDTVNNCDCNARACATRASLAL